MRDVKNFLALSKSIFPLDAKNVNVTDRTRHQVRLGFEAEGGANGCKDGLSCLYDSPIKARL